MEHEDYIAFGKSRQLKSTLLSRGHYSLGLKDSTVWGTLWGSTNSTWFLVIRLPFATGIPSLPSITLSYNCLFLFLNSCLHFELPTWGFKLTVSITHFSPSLQYYLFYLLPYICWEHCCCPSHPSPHYGIHCNWREDSGGNKIASAGCLEWSHIYKSNVCLSSYIWKHVGKYVEVYIPNSLNSYYLENVW